MGNGVRRDELIFMLETWRRSPRFSDFMMFAKTFSFVNGTLYDIASPRSSLSNMPVRRFRKGQQVHFRSETRPLR